MTCPSIRDWFNKLRCIHTIEYNADVKRNMEDLVILYYTEIPRIYNLSEKCDVQNRKQYI